MRGEILALSICLSLRGTFVLRLFWNSVAVNELTIKRPQNRQLIISLFLGTVLLQGLLVTAGFYFSAWDSPTVSAVQVQPGFANQTPDESSAIGSSPTDPATTAPLSLAESTITTELPPQALPAWKELSHRVEAGHTLSKIWSIHGAPRLGAIMAERALKELGPAALSIRAGENLTLRIDDRGEIIFLQRKLRDGSLVTIEGDSVAGYRSTNIKPIVLETERSVTGVIQTSFVQAARAQNLTYELIDEVVDLFSARLEFRRELQDGDSFTVVFTERRLEDGTILEPGPLHAASISKNGELLFAVRYLDSDQSEHYFDEHGERLGNYFLRYPVKFSRISSTFSHARFHPVLKKNRPHNGVDFAAPTGTPVRAVADGTIEVAAYKGGAGNMVQLRHCDRWTTAYLHLHTIDPSVKSSRTVRRGQVIGTVGSTGLSTGPHLHFSLFDRGTYVDPMKATLPVLTNTKVKIPSDYLRLAVLGLRKERSTIMLAENIGAVARG